MKDYYSHEADWDRYPSVLGKNVGDLSWHPALSAEQKTAIREGRLRASMYLGVMVLETIEPESPDKRLG